MNFEKGYRLVKFDLDAVFFKWVKEENWQAVEQYMIKQTQPDGAIFNQLQAYQNFSSIEVMISIRDAKNDFEEDGIWHDDGSRVFAFSMSMTTDLASLEGGMLELRAKGSDQSELIPTPEFGSAILFLTGIHGYEHRTRKVVKGQRLMVVGWCS